MPFLNREFTSSIGIAPLADTVFNRCKSELKWTEYAALSRPTIASKSEPYNVIEHGVDGLLAASADEWREHLLRLLHNPVEARKIGANARARIEREYDAVGQASRWLDVYRSL